MLRKAGRAGLSSLRLYSTIQQKPSLKLVAELRKLTEVSITKAREALSASNNDVNTALDWLQKDLVTSGAKKAAKVEGRVAGEGLIAISILSGGTRQEKGLGEGGLRASMIELNCETDFVARNELFGKLASHIAHTAAFLSEPVGSERLLRPCSLNMLNEAPLLSPHDVNSLETRTVASSINDTIAKVGEKIVLRRAVSVVQPPLPQSQPDLGLRLASYVHGSVGNASQGRIGTLALLALRSAKLPSLLSSTSFQQELARLERSIARQIVGFDTRSIRSPTGTQDETALYEQPFMMLAGEASGRPVYDALRNWASERGLAVEGEEGGVEVLEFEKWTVGHPLDAAELP